MTTPDFPLAQASELDSTPIVLTHRPGLEVFLGSTHPAGSLFECGASASTARQAHKNLVRALHNAGVPHVFAIPDVLAAAPRPELEDLAAAATEYRVDPVDDETEAACAKEKGRTEAEKELLSEEYKRDMLKTKSATELVTIVLSRPLVHLHRVAGGVVSGNALAVAGVELRPLSNLVFARDQQIVTARGLVIGSLKSTQRERESFLTSRVFDFLGIKPAGRITRSDLAKDEKDRTHIRATLEGGDFLAAPGDTAYFGNGLRSSAAATAQLLGRGIVGVKRLVVVKDTQDRQQKRMHLDTVFNLVDEKHVVAWEWAINKPEYQRRVCVYECDHKGFEDQLSADGKHCPMCGASDMALRKVYDKLVCGKCKKPYCECCCEFTEGTDVYPERVGTYKKVEEGTEFGEFLRHEGFDILLATEQEQTDYFINFINLGRMYVPKKDGKGVVPGPVRIVSVHPGLEKRLRDMGVKEEDVIVEYAEYRGITAMYGAAHCSTQAFRAQSPETFDKIKKHFDDFEKRIRESVPDSRDEFLNNVSL